MSIDSKYSDILKISKRRSKENSSDNKNEAAKPCCYQNCTKAGKYKAPMIGIGKGYLNFCLQHVRLYNKNFNAFKNMDEAEKAKFFAQHKVEHDATPALGKLRLGTIEKSKISEQFAQIRSGSARYHKRMGLNLNAQNSNSRQLTQLEKHAFEVLELPFWSSSKQIRAKYKEHVKNLHPDSNNGARGSEDLLNEIIKAYKLLRKNGLVEP